MKQNTISMNIGIEWYVRCIRNERQNGRQAKLIKRAVNIDTHRNHIIYYCVWLCMCVMLYFDFIFVADSLLSLIFYFVQFNRCFRCSQFFPNIFAIHLAKTVLHLQIKLELIVFFFFFTLFVVVLCFATQPIPHNSKLTFYSMNILLWHNGDNLIVADLLCQQYFSGDQFKVRVRFESL